MSCVRESSPQPENVNQRPEPKRRRFHPLRRLRLIFRRKAHSPEPCNEVKSCDEIIEPPILDTSKSRSTSELIDEPYTRGRSLHSNLLSVSHDSVFNPEQHSGQSDSESAVSVPRMGFPQANIQAELVAAIRRRRKIQNDDDSDVDEDLGLPRSPSMHSPTITTGNDLLLSKELITKSSHSTCSDGSLLSMGSSEMDEDSFGAYSSSRISLHDKRTSQTHLDSSDGDSSTSVPLSHSAAKHRMAIRPKRKHGNPRSKKTLSVTNALPATPEVNEEHSGRSASPETSQTVDATDSTTITSTTTTSTTTATVTITTTITSNTTTTNTTATAITTSDTIVDVSDACAAATDTATVRSCDLDTSVEEISVENVPRREEGFFHRLLSRRSIKKKSATTKSPSAEDVDVDRFLFDETMGAKPRQREEPPPASRMQLSYPADLPPDHLPQQQLHQRGTVPLAEDIFESDTFVPIKQSFSFEQYVAPITSNTNTTTTTTDDDATSSGGGSSVLKSSSSDSVSSAALDEPGVGVDLTPIVADRCRAYSSSDSSADNHYVNSQQGSLPAPVPAPRPSKLYNSAAVDVVVRRKKREDQQPELLKVFARRSLKLGKDGEPELLLLADGEEENNEYNSGTEEAIVKTGRAVVPVENKVIVVLVDSNTHSVSKVKPDVDVNENQTVATVEVAEVMPRFKRIQQRREEWEKILSEKS